MVFKERRRGSRQAVAADVEVTQLDGRRTLATRFSVKDISRSGMFLRAPLPFPFKLQERVSMKFLLENGQPELYLDGRVARIVDAETASETGQHVGFAVAFTELDDEDIEAIQRCLKVVIRAAT